MLGAIGGMEGAVFYRPVERAAPVGARAAEPRSEPGVVAEDGEPLSASTPSLENLSREKRQLLARLRGELAEKERELLHGGAEQELGETASSPASEAGDGAPEPAELSEEERAAVE